MVFSTNSDQGEDDVGECCLLVRFPFLAEEPARACVRLCASQDEDLGSGKVVDALQVRVTGFYAH